MNSLSLKSDVDSFQFKKGQPSVRKFLSEILRGIALALYIKSLKQSI